jgi:catechol 2,3-dioxygenase-like lactoylglutathione lyase family enzyme
MEVLEQNGQFLLGFAVASVPWIAHILLNRRAQKKAAEDKKPPTLLRRATLLVSDIEKSLTLYRDILGLHVVYDETTPIHPPGLPTGVSDAKSGRLVFLKSHEDHTVGVLGLYSYADIPMPKPASRRTTVIAGDSVLVFNTTQAAARMVQIKSLDKVFVERDGVTKSYKTVSGGKVTVLTNAFFDYDGHFIELNEILEGKV